MRHKGGELVECKKPSEEPGDATVIQMQYHAQSGLLLELRSGGNIYVNPNKGTLAPGPYTSFAIMGNIVIMYGTDYVHYAIWRKGNESKGGFVFLGELPEIPLIGLKPFSKLVSVESSSAFRRLTTKAEGEVDTQAVEKPDYLWFNAEKGFIDTALNEAYENRLFADRALFRMAYRLFDGSYVGHSRLYLVENNEALTGKAGDKDITVSKDDNNLISVPINDAGDESIYKVFVNGFEVKCLMGQIPEAWKDIIQSIDVFTSGSILGKKVIEEFPRLDSEGNEIKVKGAKKAERWAMKQKDELVNDIVNNASYFLYSSYDLNGKQIDIVENTSPSNLAQRRSLKEWTRHTISGDVQIYNSRAHLSKGKKGLFKGYLDMTIPNREYSTVVDSLAVKTTILTEEGRKDVVVRGKGIDMSLINRDTSQIGLPGLLSYPDARAETMTVYIWKDKQQIFKEFPLVKHESMDMAYYVNTSNRGVRYDTSFFQTRHAVSAEILDIDLLISKIRKEFENVMFQDEESYRINCRSNNKAFISIAAKTDEGWNIKEFTDGGEYGSAYGIRLIPRPSYSTEYFNEAMMSLSFREVTNEEMVYVSDIKVDDTWELQRAEDPFPEEKTSIENIGDSILRVSAVDNPFYFPTAQTYKFEGDIKGLASNAEAISTGQFGQYPLFVFTKEGIWAMQVDTSGQGVYLSQSPFSREVCSGAICPVSGGIVFTTQRGVMAISGGQVTELSKPLDGESFNLWGPSEGLWQAIWAKAGKLDYFNVYNIRQYTNGAKLAYNYLHNEVILSNIDYDYSYVYSLDNQEWSTIDTTFDVTTNSYPELVVYNNNQMKRYAFDDASTESVPVVAITRPFTLGTLDYKRLRQAALRCTFAGQLNFYLLGSNDGANFVCMTGKEIDADSLDSGTCRDLITSMSRSKQYKYFAIAIAGQMSGRVSMAELLVDAGFAVNKLR
jgi:hypothetical protein